MRLPATTVDVVDTTGAGDTVNGALAAELARGPRRCAEAARFALAAAALSTRAARRARRDADARDVHAVDVTAAPARCRRRRLARRRGPGGVGGVDRAAPARRARVRARSSRTGPRGCPGCAPGVLSDLHAGVPHAGLATIRRAVDELNAREPDVHLLLGDYLDASQALRRQLAPERVADELARLRSPLGTVAVIGNHDWRNSGDRMWRALEAVGITVLEDRAVELQRPAAFWVAGLADLRHRRPDIGARAARGPRAAHPCSCSRTTPTCSRACRPRVALTLSGHTHGGQVAIPLLRRPMLPSYYGERYARGHVVEHGRHLLVTSGVGTSGLPIRFLAPPEVLVLTLRNL